MFKFRLWLAWRHFSAFINSLVPDRIKNRKLYKQLSEAGKKGANSGTMIKYFYDHVSKEDMVFDHPGFIKYFQPEFIDNPDRKFWQFWKPSEIRNPDYLPHDEVVTIDIQRQIRG